jgi:hypothetical protein
MTITMKFKKSTKGTFVFEEVVPKGGVPLVGTLYTKKHTFGGNAPKAITVSLERIDNYAG